MEIVIVLMFLVMILFVGWLPGYQREMGQQADDQIDKGDYGGCLSTSFGVFAVTVALVVVGILLVALAS